MPQSLSVIMGKRSHCEGCVLEVEGQSQPLHNCFLFGLRFESEPSGQERSLMLSRDCPGLGQHPCANLRVPGPCCPQKGSIKAVSQEGGHAS